MKKTCKRNEDDCVDKFLSAHKKGYRYKHDFANTDGIEKDILFDYIRSTNILRNTLNEKCKRLRESNYYENDYVANLDNLYRVFHNLNIEKREMGKITNAIDKFAEIVHIKRFLSDWIIDTITHINIDAMNRDEVENLLGMILNDITFYYTYIKNDDRAIEAIKNILRQLEETRNGGDIFSGGSDDCNTEYFEDDDVESCAAYGEDADNDDFE